MYSSQPSLQGSSARCDLLQQGRAAGDKCRWPRGTSCFACMKMLKILFKVFGLCEGFPWTQWELLEWCSFEVLCRSPVWISFPLLAVHCWHLCSTSCGWLLKVCFVRGLLYVKGEIATKLSCLSVRCSTFPSCFWTERPTTCFWLLNCASGLAFGTKLILYLAEIVNTGAIWGWQIAEAIVPFSVAGF